MPHTPNPTTAILREVDVFKRFHFAIKLTFRECSYSPADHNAWEAGHILHSLCRSVVTAWILDPVADDGALESDFR
jgi:hypothetical protein